MNATGTISDKVCAACGQDVYQGAGWLWYHEITFKDPSPLMRRYLATVAREVTERVADDDSRAFTIGAADENTMHRMREHVPPEGLGEDIPGPLRDTRIRVWRGSYHR